MRQISLVGAVDEEVGNYFPEFLDMLEESPFLKVKKMKIYFLKIIHILWAILGGGMLWKSILKEKCNALK